MNCSKYDYCCGILAQHVGDCDSMALKWGSEICGAKVDHIQESMDLRDSSQSATDLKLDFDWRKWLKNVFGLQTAMK